MRYPIVAFAARSDMGRVRRNNEDNLFCNGEILTAKMRELPYKTSGKSSTPAVFAVCDGMGGHQFGEEASLAAVQVLSQFNERILSSCAQQLDELVQEYVAETNRHIRQLTESRSVSMGTTFALAVILSDEIRAFNMGDSRIYLSDKNGFRQISNDHTLAMNKIRSGEYSEEQARKSGDWSRLTACLGFPDDGGNDYKCEAAMPVKITGNARLLLCSDGLSDVLTDNNIERLLKVNKTAEKATSELMSEALNNGGTDNVTVVVVDIAASKLSKLLG